MKYIHHFNLINCRLTKPVVYTLLTPKYEEVIVTCKSVNQVRDLSIRAGKEQLWLVVDTLDKLSSIERTLLRGVWNTSYIDPFSFDAGSSVKELYENINDFYVECTSQYNRELE